MNLKYILKDFKNQKRFVILFVLNLCLGLSGFISIEIFKSSIQQTLSAKSKESLGADFGLSSRRPISKKELDSLKEILPSTERTEIIEIYSMAKKSNRTTRLIQIKSIEDNFPFYGSMEFKDQSKLDKINIKELFSANNIWVFEDLALQLELQANDKLTIGDKLFTVKRIITDDTTSGFDNSIAPKVYMSKENLLSTGLVQKRSLAWYSHLFKIPNANIAELDTYRDLAFDKISNSDVRIYTHQNASEQMGRLISRLNDFLGLSSLVALFLSAIGSGFLFRSYIRSKVKEIAILISLGKTHISASMIYFIQVFLLGLVSAFIALGLSFILSPRLEVLTNELLPYQLNFNISPKLVLIAIAISSLGSLLICLPSLAKILNIKPAILLNESQDDSSTFNFKSILYFLPGAICFWLLSIFLSNSPLIGSVFSGTLIAASAILVALSLIIFKLLELLNTRSLSIKWALLDLSRKKITTASCFLSIGLGMTLLNLIPQIQVSIDQELASPESSKVPNLFMFDIQEEQKQDLEKLLVKNGANLSQISPMVRARLLKVNDKDFSKGKGAYSGMSREEQREMRFRNRGFNLSYRDQLHESERVLRGQFFKGAYQGEGLAEISLEKRFADRLDLKINDKLGFDIQSVPVEGKVTSIRSVKWTSFQPNFFIQFQPGVLELAPKTYLATISRMTKKESAELQKVIVQDFPNVSIIDVSILIKKLQSIISQMSLALNFMSILCIFAGFIVIFSIANHQAQSQRWDIGLLKSLGADFKIINNKYLWQFSIISFIAGSFGVIISLTVSYIISVLIFESFWNFDYETPLLSLAVCVLFTLVISHFAIRKALSIKSNKLFTNRG